MDSSRLRAGDCRNPPANTSLSTTFGWAVLARRQERVDHALGRARRSRSRSAARAASASGRSSADSAASARKKRAADGSRSRRRPSASVAAVAAATNAVDALCEVACRARRAYRPRPRRRGTSIVAPRASRSASRPFPKSSLAQSPRVVGTGSARVPRGAPARTRRGKALSQRARFCIVHGGLPRACVVGTPRESSLGGTIQTKFSSGATAKSDARPETHWPRGNGASPRRTTRRRTPAGPFPPRPRRREARRSIWASLEDDALARSSALVGDPKSLDLACRWIPALARRAGDVRRVAHAVQLSSAGRRASGGPRRGASPRECAAASRTTRAYAREPDAARHVQARPWRGDAAPRYTRGRLRLGWARCASTDRAAAARRQRTPRRGREPPKRDVRRPDASRDRRAARVAAVRERARENLDADRPTRAI